MMIKRSWYKNKQFDKVEIQFNQKVPFIKHAYHTKTESVQGKHNYEDV